MAVEVPADFRWKSKRKTETGFAWPPAGEKKTDLSEFIPVWFKSDGVINKEHRVTHHDYLLVGYPISNQKRKKIFNKFTQRGGALRHVTRGQPGD